MELRSDGGANLENPKTSERVDSDCFDHENVSHSV